MRLRVVVMLLLGAMTCGCSKGGTPLVVEPPAPVAPVASTPASAVEAMVHAYSSRDLSAYRTLFTTDFAFAFVSGDLAGAPYQQTGWTRSDELISAANLFVNGTTSLPPARRIELAATGALVAIPDDRPGKSARYHSMVTVDFSLRADLESIVWILTDEETFYLVRGDSAGVPPGVTLPADSTRWYIERWEERFAGGPPKTMRRGTVSPAQTTPTGQHTWGGLKAMYRVL